MLDTKGPGIKTGALRDNKAIDIIANQPLKISCDPQIEGDLKQIACDYKQLPQTVSVGSIIFIDSGGLTCEVTEVHDDHVVVICKNNFKLHEKKPINLPGAIIDFPPLTPSDEDDINEFGIP